MTRSDIIARIREIESRMGLSPLKGLSRAVKAVLQDDLEHLMYMVEVAAHEENESRAGAHEVQVFDAATGEWTTQTIAEMQPETRVGTLVQVDEAPGVWEIIITNPANWDFAGGYRLLTAVDEEAKRYSREIMVGPIVRHVSEIRTGLPEATRQAALAVNSEMTSTELFDLAWNARDKGEFWAAYVLDNMAEDAGGHADGRATCYACGTWANHAHDPITTRKVYEWPQVDTDVRGIMARVHPVQTVTV